MMKKCPNCGHPAPDENNFCKYCGVALVDGSTMVVVEIPEDDKVTKRDMPLFNLITILLFPLPGIMISTDSPDCSGVARIVLMLFVILGAIMFLGSIGVLI